MPVAVVVSGLADSVVVVDLPDSGVQLTCSARGCRAPAEYALRWNNPKLHTGERRKTWLACAEHRASLTEFLEIRGFLREVEPVG